MRKLASLLIALIALTLIAPAPAASASASASAGVALPLGRLESVQGNEFSDLVRMAGWALDPAVRNRPTSVQVTVDGRNLGGPQTAGILRVDVNRALHATGGHGFGITVAVPTGNHRICVYARTHSGTWSISLACFQFRASARATKARMLATAASIDPRHTIKWVWAALPAGTPALAAPWTGRITISSTNSVRYLRALMLNQWSYVLEYKAFGTAWPNAIRSFNALLGHPGDTRSYTGVEAGANCISAALGADHLIGRCPAALRQFSARIAHGTMMNKPQGHLDAVRVVHSTATVAGWTLDPAQPTKSNSVRITDNGRIRTGWVTTNLLRTDVNRATGVTGRHGYRVAIALTRGHHRICASARTVRSGGVALILPKCVAVNVI